MQVQITYKHSTRRSNVVRQCQRQLRSMGFVNGIRGMEFIQPKILIHRVLAARILVVDTRDFLGLVGFTQSGGVLEVRCLRERGWIANDL